MSKKYGTKSREDRRKTRRELPYSPAEESAMKRNLTVMMPVMRASIDESQGILLSSDKQAKGQCCLAIPLTAAIRDHFGHSLWPGESMSVTTSSVMVGIEIEIEGYGSLDVATFIRDAVEDGKAVSVQHGEFDVGKMEDGHLRLSTFEECGIIIGDEHAAGIFDESEKDIPDVRPWQRHPEWSLYDRVVKNLSAPTKDGAVALARSKEGWQRQLNVFGTGSTRLLKVSAMFKQIFDLKKTRDNNPSLTCTPQLEMVVVLQHREGMPATKNMAVVLKGVKVAIRYYSS
ncbi:MAG: hypothetical protein M1837_006943 [Sclerophora amabilis]|nr:MAG: hypothetical protein M1837_006943 [Sclerophora amabilis]